jgi:copper chaperone CopZ
MKTTIEIENLKCHGCANTIKKNLSKINGVISVEVVFEPESVVIEYDDQIANENMFIEKLSDLGYPKKGYNSAGKQLKSFVSCAIGRMTKKE